MSLATAVWPSKVRDQYSPSRRKTPAVTVGTREALDCAGRAAAALSADAREQGGLHFVMLDIEPGQITPIAEAVFRLAGVKPDFLPQIAPPPYYGVRNY